MLKIYVKKSKIAGRGLFARAAISEGELLGIVEGPVVPNTAESCKKYRSDYLHPISHTQAILNSNITRYTNHSCEPNCGLKDGLKLVAMRTIKKGEELTIDYDTLEYDWKMKCMCRSLNCRKEIKGYKYLNKKLKKRYGPLISPYLLKSK